MSKNKKKKQSVKPSKLLSSAKKMVKKVKTVLKAKPVKAKEKAPKAKMAKPTQPVKVVAPKKEEKIKTAAAKPVVPVADKSKKSKKAKKTQDTVELQDDFIETDGTSDEIGEYEEELKAVEEIDSETDDEELWSSDLKEKSNDEEIVLTDAEGNRYCRARDCDQIGTVDGYCRYHYLLFWKKIQVRKKILVDGKLERYIEELTARYPDKFLEMIRRDLRTQKDFLSAIQELEIDESAVDNEFEEESQSFIDEVRGINETTSVDDDEF